MPIALPEGETFNLRARADRIEAGLDGAFAIVDFKTGQPPSAKEVFAGFSPQLTLEAAMLMAGAFKGVPIARARRRTFSTCTSPAGATRSTRVAIEPRRATARTVAGDRRRASPRASSG